MLECGLEYLEKTSANETASVVVVHAAVCFWFVGFIMSRLRRKDWTRMGLKLLATGGPAALRLDQLCRKAGKTRGSFYHHFADHDTFTSEMISVWIEENTEQIIERVNEAKSNRRGKLFAAVGDINHNVEIAIRKLAVSNAVAEKAVAKVDRMRIDFLEDIFKDELGIDAKRASLLAEIQYCSFLGMQILRPEKKRRQQMGEMIDRMLSAVSEDFDSKLR